MLFWPKSNLEVELFDLQDFFVGWDPSQEAERSEIEDSGAQAQERNVTYVTMLSKRQANQMVHIKGDLRHTTNNHQLKN